MTTVLSLTVCVQCGTAQRAAAGFSSSCPAATAKSCPKTTSSRMPSGATSGGPAERSSGAKWRDATSSTRWKSWWRPWLPVHTFCPQSKSRDSWLLDERVLSSPHGSSQMFTLNMVFQSSVVQRHFCNKMNVEICVLLPVFVFLMNTCSLLTVTAASGSVERWTLPSQDKRHSAPLEAADISKCVIKILIQKFWSQIWGKKSSGS